MSSKSKSKTSSSNTSNVTNENISGIDDSQIFSDTGDIMLTDFGSVNSSFEFAGDGLDAILDFGTNIIDNQQLQLGDTLKSINAANNSTAQLSNISAEESIKVAVKYISIAAAVVGGLWILKKGVK